MPINLVCEYNKHMYNATDPIDTVNVYMPLVSGRVDKEDEWDVYRIESNLFCGQMIYRCHRKIYRGKKMNGAIER